MIPAGYNLRGLIMDYLEAKGWRWDDASESWTREGLVFSGVFATSQAMVEQIETEEGREVAV